MQRNLFDDYIFSKVSVLVYYMKIICLDINVLIAPNRKKGW